MVGSAVGSGSLVVIGVGDGGSTVGVALGRGKVAVGSGKVGVALGGGTVLVGGTAVGVGVDRIIV
jgi:hypothetical protein